MNEANLTRFGPQTIGREQGTPTRYSATFRAIDGPANLVLRNNGIDNVQVRLNGLDVVGPQGVRGDGEIVIPLTLGKENTIELTVPAGPPATCNVRVTQVARADIGLQRQGYFGLNTSDMARQRAFYETLGFTGEIFPAGPETSTTFRSRSASSTTT